MVDVDTAFGGACIGLSALYGCMALWCVYKTLEFFGASAHFSSQKWMHLSIAAASAIRCAEFIMLRNAAEAYYYTQVSSETASTWLYVGDELPSLLICFALAPLIHTWGYSYHTATQSVSWYRKVALRWGLLALSFLGLLQLGLWIAYEHIKGQRHVIAAVEGAAYAVAYAVLAVGMTLYGFRAGNIYKTIAGAALSLRQKSSRRVFIQTSIAGLTLSLRAFVGLAVAIGAARNWDTNVEKSTLGVAATVVVYVSLEAFPLIAILRQNRHTAGASTVPSPGAVVEYWGRVMHHWLTCACFRRRARYVEVDNTYVDPLLHNSSLSSDVALTSWQKEDQRAPAQPGNVVRLSSSAAVLPVPPSYGTSADSGSP